MAVDVTHYDRCNRHVQASVASELTVGALLEQQVVGTGQIGSGSSLGTRPPAFSLVLYGSLTVTHDKG